MFSCKRDYGYEEFDRYIPDNDILQGELPEPTCGELGLALCIQEDNDALISQKDLIPINRKRKRHFIDDLMIHKDSGALCFPMYHNYDNKDNGSIIDDILIRVLKKFKKIWFSRYFNQPIDFLPDNIEELRLGVSFLQPLIKLPSELKSLFIHSNVSLDNLPSSIENLYLGGDFNLSINNLSEGVKRIYIESEFFNLPIDNLPNTLEELYIIGKFNQPLENLPNSLKILTVDCVNYTNDLTNLPSSLEILEIYNGFTGALKIPINTKILKFYDFDRSIENLLNEGLEELYFNGKFNQPLNNGENTFLPSTLKKLCIKSSNSNISIFNQNLDFLPNRLENLELILPEDYSFDINSLPSDLKVLDIYRDSYKNNKIFTIKVLPKSIQVLKLNISTGCCIPEIPNSCKTLSCYINSKYKPFVLPTNVEHLELHKVIETEHFESQTLQQIVDIEHNNHVQHVLNTFKKNDDEFLNIIKGYTFPNSLIHLEIYNIDCRQVTLPDGLKNLIINDYSSKPYFINLPDSIEYLQTCHIEFIDKLPNNLIKLSTNYSNKKLIEGLSGSYNQNIKFDYFGKLERQYAYSSAFSFI